MTSRYSTMIQYYAKSTITGSVQSAEEFTQITPMNVWEKLCISFWGRGGGKPKAGGEINDNFDDIY